MTGTSLEPTAMAPDQKVVDGALRCIARWGVTKTTLDDIAREAGCSRATVYRLFPGGKQSLLQAIGQREVARLLLAVTEAIDAAPDLPTLLLDALVATGRFIEDNDALTMMMRHEPNVLLPFLSFDRLDPILETASAFLGPLVARFVDPQTAGEVVEWAARLVLSYTCEPTLTVDLTDPISVEALVTGHMLPGIEIATRPATPTQC